MRKVAASMFFLALLLVAYASALSGQCSMSVEPQTTVATVGDSPADVSSRNRISMSGTLNVVLSDSKKCESPAIYYLYTNSREYVRIHPTKPLPLSYSGRNVTATGILTSIDDTKVLNASEITLTDGAPISATVTGTEKIVILLLEYSDSAAYIPNEPSYYSSLMNPTSNSVNAFYLEESYGLFGVQADVYGWYSLPKPRSYYVNEITGAHLDRIVDDGVAVADPDVYFPNYDEVSFAMNDYLDCCAWGGGWSITADGVTKYYGATWMPPWAQNAGVYAHEIGHSIGCPHTGWVYGTYDSIWDVESGGDWFNPQLRGSYYSVATGQTENLYSYDPCHHIAYHKIRMGWLDGWFAELNYSVSTLTLNALAGSTASVMAVKVNIQGEDPTRRYFVVEARTQINYDQWLPGEGIIIHWVDEDRIAGGVGGNENIPAYPIDSTPGTQTLSDAQWTVGSTYYNASYALSIQVISKNGNSYQVGFENQISVSTVTVAVSPTGAGSVSVDGAPVATPYMSNWIVGSTHTLAATPLGNAPFGGWSCSGDLSCSAPFSSTTIVTVNGAGNVTANFGTPIVFDFRLYNSGSYSNLGGIEVPRGGSGSVTITVTLENGPAETVTLSCADTASGESLPNGVTCSFSAESGSPPFTSTLIVYATSSTPAGYYTLKITGTAGDVTRQALFILIVT